MLIFGIGSVLEPMIYLIGSQLIIVASIITLCCSYYFVWKAFRQSGKRLAQINNVSNQAEELKRHKMERKLVNKVLTLIGFYMGAVVPALIFAFIALVQWLRPHILLEEVIKYANLFMTYVGLSNSCCNPIIYVWKDATFRAACKRFLRKKDVIPSPRNNPTLQSSV